MSQENNKRNEELQKLEHEVKKTELLLKLKHMELEALKIQVEIEKHHNELENISKSSEIPDPEVNASNL